MLVELATTIVGLIQWFTRNQMFGKQQEEIPMLLVAFCTSKAMLKMVGYAVRQVFVHDRQQQVKIGKAVDTTLMRACSTFCRDTPLTELSLGS